MTHKMLFVQLISYYKGEKYYIYNSECFDLQILEVVWREKCKEKTNAALDKICTPIQLYEFAKKKKNRHRPEIEWF